MASVSVEISGPNADRASLCLKIDSKRHKLGAKSGSMEAKLRTIENAVELDATVEVGQITVSTDKFPRFDRCLTVSGRNLCINVKFYHQTDVANGIKWGACNGKVEHLNGELIAKIDLDPKLCGYAKFESINSELVFMTERRDSDINTTVEGKVEMESTIKLVVDLCEMTVRGEQVTIKFT